MVFISWFKEIKGWDASENPGVMLRFPNHLKSWLLNLLACSDPAFPTKDSILPYSELSRTYSKMRGEAAQLLHAIESSGMFENFLSTTKFESEILSADDAISLASKIPTLFDDKVGNDTLGRHVDDIESAKQRLLTTSGYLKCVQVCCKWTFFDHMLFIYYIHFFNPSSVVILPLRLC